MRVFVTGHRGYIGTKLVPMLQERDHDVFGLDSDLYSSCDFGGSPPEIEHSTSDIRNATVEMLEGFDAVVHLAGLSNDPLGDYDPSLTQDINEDASIRLAKLAKKAGVQRFLFASSCSNYGASDDNFLTETANFNPVTPYGRSKVNVEAAVGPMADNSFSPTFLRASTFTFERP